MLGCQDFCGYYDWTFHYLRHRVALDAPDRLWTTALPQTQRHYLEAGKAKGLRGLYEAWLGTGESEGCDWTFTLDEAKNILRWDMRQCPSKGFLIENDLSADEDYCDHCMGWVKPLLEAMGAEVLEHEHNHCGQCFAEMRMKDRPAQTLAGLDCNITRDPRWQHGYVERWEKGVKLPMLPDASAATDPVEIVRAWFAGAKVAAVSDFKIGEPDQTRKTVVAVIVTDEVYALGPYAGSPRGVLIGCDSGVLPALAQRFHETPPARRPLLMHPYFPRAPMSPFTRFHLPCPIPILPLLLRTGLYEHVPFASIPTTNDLAVLLATALNVGDRRKDPGGVDADR